MPKTLTALYILAQGEKALRSAELWGKIFCMVAGTGRDRDRDSSEERPDYGGPEEPVAPGDIIGAEEPSGPSEPVGEEAARKAAEEEAARKAAEEEAAK